ncbi:hypothetical protein KO529_04835 [Arenibacter algicola]|uniref:hypothetical protein n=1 Tax=Arenibacter algicola TaxID=616991 RepID=UPI001C07ECDB|nr:hypothetical protein [Arenibacter algicola]MBU2904101.1 hypothetical protein [Arenibacter algicola]
MKIKRRSFIHKTVTGSTGILLGGMGMYAGSCSNSFIENNNINCSIINENGEAKVKIENKVFDPMAFRSFSPEPYNIKDFYNSGVRLMGILHSGMPCTLGVPYSQYGEHWIGPGKYDFSKIDDQMKVFLDNAPEAYFNIKLMLDTRPWYLNENPGCRNSYRELSSMAGNENWRKDVAKYLKDVIGYLEKNYGDRIYAYTLMAGSSTEWYTEHNYAAKSNIYYESDGSKPPLLKIDIDRNSLKEEAYGKWLNKPDVKLPPLDSLEHTSHGVFRDISVQKDKEGFDYWQFQSKIVGDAACYFAEIVKNITQGRKLTGLFYGYLTLLTGRRSLCNGHLGFEQVWNSPHFDMIYGPCRYETRQLTDASGYLVPVDSVTLRGKLYFQEIDYRFAVGDKRILENGHDLGRTHTPETPINVSKNCIRREFVNTLEKRTGMWWFDFFGYNYIDPTLINEVVDTMSVRERLKEIDIDKIAEIAIFTDTESQFYLNQDSDVDDKNIARQITEFSFLGAPHDSFTFSDLERACDKKKYKLIFFLNTFKIPEDKLTYIETKLKKDGRTLVFLYAPGYITDDAFSVDRMASVLEMEVKCEMKPTRNIIMGKSLNQELTGTAFGYKTEVSPKFSVDDDNLTVFGEYEDGGNAFALKQFENYNMCYAGSGTIPFRVLRELARNAGVHIYYEGNDPIYVNSRLVGIHHVNDKDAVIHMPSDCGGEVLFGGERIVSANKKFHLNLEYGEMNAILLDEAIRV